LVGNGAAWSEATLQAIKAPANAHPKATLKVCMFSSVIWCQMPRNEAALGRTTHSPAAGFHTGSDLSKEIKHLEETGVIPRITPSECRPECRPAATSSSARRSAWITQLYSFPELPPDAAQFLEQVFFDYADRVASDALRNHLASTPTLLCAS